MTFASQDPANAVWQRDLSINYDRIGAVLVARGQADAGLRAYREGLRIRERLAAQDPANGAWQRDLSVSYYNLARVHKESGEIAEANELWRLCYQKLKRMRGANMFLDPSSAQVFEELDGQFGE